MFDRSAHRFYFRGLRQLIVSAALVFALERHSFVRADNWLTQWVHEQWQTDRGLPQNSVFCFAQDPRGFLWFGTENGLLRFDGVEFRVFNQQTPPHLRHNFISSLLVAKDGTLWAATRTGGLVRYKNGEFETPFPDLADERVLAITQTADGSVWLGTPAGLIEIKDGTVTSYTFDDGLPTGGVTALLAAADGSLWIGTSEGRLARFAGGKLASIPPLDGGRESKVTAIVEQPASREIWIAYDGQGLGRLKNGELERINILGRDIENFQALLVDGEGALWIGTQYDGLIRYKDGSTCGLTAQDGLNSENVMALFEDRDGSVWAGTLFGGLHRLHRGAVSTYGRREGLAAESLTCVVETEPGEFWVGTKGEGLFKFEGGSSTRINTSNVSLDIRAILRSREGDVWVGAKDGGLLRFSNGTRTLLTTADGLVSDSVSSLHQVKSGEIWVGSQRDGISVLDPNGRVLRTLTDRAFRAHVRCFAEDADGTLWIGTQNGLIRYGAGGAVQAGYLKGFADASIRSLLVDEKSTLWIGTRDDGLLRLRHDSLFQFEAPQGLVHTRIYQLLSDGTTLWIAGNRGIEYVAISELEAVAGGRAQRVSTRVLSERDGLRTAECSADATPTAGVGSDGKLWFATRRGLAAVERQWIRNEASFPQVFLKRVSLDNEPVSAHRFTEVPAGTTRVQFSYVAPYLRNGASISYRFRLEGVDPEWLQAGREREAVYYHLRPGRYTFRVMASNERGAWPKESTALAFSVAPRFYETAWFVCAAAFGGLGGIGGLYRWRVAGIQSRNKKLKELVHLRTRELEEEIVQRKYAQQEQMALNVDLETRVQARTAELSGAYKNLQTELRERKRVEDELASSEARLRRVVDSGMVGILFWNKQGQIVDANDTFLRMVGYSREDLRQGALYWSRITPEEYAHLDRAGLEEIDRTGVCQPFEKEYIRKDGSRFPILLGGASLCPDAREGVCFVLDISERKASEEQVRSLALSLEERVRERTIELARINEQLASEVLERKRVAIALSAFSQLGQKLHSARTEKEAASTIALTAKSLIPHDRCTIELYGPDNRLYPVIQNGVGEDPSLAEPMLSKVSVPIRNGSRVIGVIGLQSTALEAFHSGDANALQALGDYCGGALDRIHAEEAWRETERRFSAFMANAPALAWMKDARLSYVFTNTMFQKFTGLSADEIEGRTDSDLWPQSTAERIRNNDLRLFQSDSPIETHETVRSADGEARTLLTFRFPFTTANGERFVAGMAVDISEQKRAEEALHRLPQNILEAQEQERRRLARELHDSVNQAIASAKFRIQTAENQILRGDAKWQESCRKSKQMLDLVLQQVRQLSHNLRPGELDDLGLIPAARTAFREFEDRTGIAIHFTEMGMEARLAAPLESTLYRIIQEALTNIEKHSSAKMVEICLHKDDSSVTLEISDDGVGFLASEARHGRAGLGLLHMRERANLVGGAFTFETSPGKGVRLVIQVPCSSRKEDHE